MKNNYITPNPYVFPFSEFKNLSLKKLQKISGKKKVKFSDISAFVDLYNQKQRLEQRILREVPSNSSLAEQVFSVFIHPDIRFGELKMYQENKKNWIERFEKSIKDKGFVFSLLGLPFKVPIALKTKRTAPDLGEVMALNKLESLARIIESLTGVSVDINVVTEGAFAKFVGVKESTAEKYGLLAKRLAKDLGFTHLNFIPLSKMESYDKKFPILFRKKVAELKKRYTDKDPNITEKIEGAYSVIMRIVNPKIDDLYFLMDLYNLKLPKSKSTDSVEQKRQWLKDFTLQSTIEYFAYLELRDELRFLEKEFGKNYLPLTVSPKPNRLGIIPIDKTVTLLPHHGVPVIDKNNKFRIYYLIDLLRSKQKVKEAYLVGDSDPAPFFYYL